MKVKDCFSSAMLFSRSWTDSPPIWNCIASSHNLTEIAAVTDVLIFIRDGKIIKIVENDYNEKELEALYEDIMTSGQREEA